MPARLVTVCRLCVVFCRSVRRRFALRRTFTHRVEPRLDGADAYQTISDGLLPLRALFDDSFRELRPVHVAH